MRAQKLTVILFLLCVQAGLSQPYSTYAQADSLMRVYEPGESHASDSLLAFVRRNFASDSLRVRAFYTWIATHISYDLALYDDFRSRSMLALTELRPGGQSQDADTVMLRRKAVCEGICNLMNKLCAKSGLVSVLVPGITRSAEGEVTENILHTWNAVKVGNAWRLLDITWATGYINYRRQYVRRFSSDYFFTLPQVFVRTHWPLDAMWQLLPHPVSKSAFYEGREDVPGPRFHFLDSINDFLSLKQHEQEYVALAHYHRYDPGNKMYVDAYDHAIYNRAATLFNKAGLYFDDYAAYAKSLKGKQIGLAEVKKCIRLLLVPKQYLEEGLFFSRGRKFSSEEVKARFDQMVQGSTKKLVEINRFLDSYYRMEASLK